jgi:hypothetical protein
VEGASESELLLSLAKLEKAIKPDLARILHPEPKEQARQPSRPMQELANPIKPVAKPMPQPMP